MACYYFTFNKLTWIFTDFYLFNRWVYHRYGGWNIIVDIGIIWFEFAAWIIKCWEFSFQWFMYTTGFIFILSGKLVLFSIIFLYAMHGLAIIFIETTFKLFYALVCLIWRSFWPNSIKKIGTLANSTVIKLNCLRNWADFGINVCVSDFKNFIVGF